MNELHIHEVPQNNGLTFHMGEVSELYRKTMANSSHVFNLSNCVQKYLKYNNSLGKINVRVLK